MPTSLDALADDLSPAATFGLAFSVPPPDFLDGEYVLNDGG